MTVESARRAPRAAVKPRTDGLVRYYEMVRAERPDVNVANLRFYTSRLFEGVPLKRAVVLDIGAGDGLYSLYTVGAGATRLVALEPEVAGSSPGMRERFESAATRLGADSAELRAETFQEYDPGQERFNVVLSHSSINHLDEPACVELQRDEGARASYKELFAKLAAMTSPGGSLVVADCSNRNLFAHLPVRNPVARYIEWEKHQPPEVWIDLLQEAGFEEPRVWWSSFNTLRKPGQILLGNRPAAWMLQSAFGLTMTRGAS
jgi:SAM-dependent methyltransferase